MTAFDHPARLNSNVRAIMARQGRVMRLAIFIALVAAVVAQREAVDEELLQRPRVEQGDDHSMHPRIIPAVP